MHKNFLRNNRNGQNAQKMHRNGQNTNSSKTLQILQNFLRNNRSGQMAQKLSAKQQKRPRLNPKRQKKRKKIENCLNMIFMTKYQKKKSF